MLPVFCAVHILLLLEFSLDFGFSFFSSSYVAFLAFSLWNKKPPLSPVHSDTFIFYFLPDSLCIMPCHWKHLHACHKYNVVSSVSALLILNLRFGQVNNGRVVNRNSRVKAKWKRIKEPDESCSIYHVVKSCLVSLLFLQGYLHADSRDLCPRSRRDMGLPKCPDF